MENDTLRGFDRQFLVVHPNIPARAATAVRDHGGLERRLNVLRLTRDTGVTGRCGDWHQREAYQIASGKCG
jgi:hypothetical protein